MKNVKNRKTKCRILSVSVVQCFCLGLGGKRSVCIADYIGGGVVYLSFMPHYSGTLQRSKFSGGYSQVLENHQNSCVFMFIYCSSLCYFLIFVFPINCPSGTSSRVVMNSAMTTDSGLVH